MDHHYGSRHTYAGGAGGYGGLGSTSGYGRTIDSRYGSGTNSYISGRVNQSSTYTCHYCGKAFNYQYDLNNHYVYCSKRTGKYGAEERGLISGSKYSTDIDTYGSVPSYEVKDPLLFDPKEPQFGLINSYKHN